MQLLFDASAFLNIILQREKEASGLLKSQHILDLTLYESGNALWRLATIQRKIAVEEAKLVLKTVMSLSRRMEKISPYDVDPYLAMNIAHSETITFYDASYLAAAKARQLTLVTDDGRLAKVASSYVNLKHSDQL